MKRSEALAALWLLAASPAAAADPAPVVAAERAFAARAAEVGVSTSFLEFMADDAVVFDPQPTSARRLYGALPPSKPPGQGGTWLIWRPALAGLAAAGDLGFTTGPAQVNGRPTADYVTVWRRQADGGWRWVFDGGAGAGREHEEPEAAVRALAAGVAQAVTPEQAMTQVRAAESALAAAAFHDAAKAFAAALAPDARRQVATRPASLAFTNLGGEAAASGDLAWTYGVARWTRGDAPAVGHYVRVWRHDPGGWRLVFDQLQDDDPPPPPAQKPE